MVGYVCVSNIQGTIDDGHLRFGRWITRLVVRKTHRKKNIASRVLFPKLAHFRAMPAYLKNARLSENPSQCVVDTGFTVQNDEVHRLSDRQAASIAYLRKRGKWTNGNGSTGLDPGQEFLAIMMY